MSGELAKRGGCRSARFLLEQMNTSVVEGRRMRFRDADPTSTFLGVSRRLDVGCGGGAFKHLWEECRGPFGGPNRGCSEGCGGSERCHGLDVS